MPQGEGTYGSKVGRPKKKGPMNAKYGKKGSEYRPGTLVPAIEESLYTEDDLG
tara:strand:+ start:835 stop:993 length:159 start_codon:yes stop_codon:yes gene_type:complete